MHPTLVVPIARPAVRTKPSSVPLLSLSRSGWSGVIIPDLDRFVLHAEQIARSTARMGGLIFGIDEYEKADVQKGLGAIVIDDQLVDAAVLRVEWRKLAIARRAGLA